MTALEEGNCTDKFRKLTYVVHKIMNREVLQWAGGRGKRVLRRRQGRGRRLGKGGRGHHRTCVTLKTHSACVRGPFAPGS